jgi:hypothetical protein
MTNHRAESAISRRTALAGLSAGGVGLALAATARPAAAQDAATATAGHPIVGAWRGITPGGPALTIFHPDGTAVFADPPTTVDPALGVVSRSLGIATWEPTGARSIHFTATELYSDASGTFLTFGTVDGYPEVSEDGQTLHDDQSRVTITIRDAEGAIVQEIAAAGAPPVIAYRMGVGNPGFPEGAGGTATPTA